MTGFATIEEALAQVRAGRPVLVLDDETRENEGDAILAAGTAGAEWVGWMVRHTSGYLCAPMTEERADRLGLPLMWPSSQDPLRTRYTVSVDAATGTTTGISAAERAATARTLAGPDAQSTDFIRPGHILPLRARDGGVLERRGHTEAAVDLARLAGLEPVGLIGEIVDDAGACLRTPDVLALGAREHLCVITIEQLAAWRRDHDDLPAAPAARVTAGDEAVLPTRHGEFRVTGYRDHLTGAEHLLLIPSTGLGADDGGAPWVRVHSECLTGDALGSLRCDCGEQLSRSMDQVARHGGAVILLRGQEGRGVGLINKIAAYHAQDGGLDTVDAQTALGLPVDAREYGAAVAVLAGLGVSAVRLLTNNPAKIASLRRAGIEVDPRPLQIPPRPEDIAYLRTKRDRMGHLIELDETGPDNTAHDNTEGIA
ncbi:3,4-dihydroxy-2-butanone-4-phosphate synthase [Acidipropionibacterium virtanenii]|uniref:GTP cyclohydrolase-2 n=1 Tax=Acidipropionibacterium virtanenii TaxID=2057246 RepID=A0A344USH7_9ACTN|nr:3,4-dihydroxy-2-butanone-4-phosphate synthase [Acidipropionibacterium virtanenii]AXE38225.1 Riboflavin biosynthesis protein RibBA [Acidipropionibacterium virtanenii]